MAHLAMFRRSSGLPAAGMRRRQGRGVAGDVAPHRPTLSTHTRPPGSARLSNFGTVGSSAAGPLSGAASRFQGRCPRGGVRAAAAPSTLTVPPSTAVSKFRFNTKEGNVVRVQVTPGHDAAEVLIAAEMPTRTPGQGPAPILHWGMHRAALDKWYHPQDVTPPGSTLDEGSGGMRSTTVWDQGQGAFVVRMRVPNRLLPLHLSMLLVLKPAQNGAPEQLDTPLRGSFMCVPLGMSPGCPEPLGPSLALPLDPNAPKGADGLPAVTTSGYSVNFSVFSRHSKGMSLVLVRLKAGEDGQPISQPSAQGQALVGSGCLEIALDPVSNRTGDCWHVCVHNLKNPETMSYGWRATGEGDGFHAGYVLLDPYATRVSWVTLPESYFNQAPALPPYLDMTRPVMLGCLAALPVPAPSVDPTRGGQAKNAFDWQGQQRPARGNGGGNGGRTVVCEIDVPAFTSPNALPNTGTPAPTSGQFLSLLERVPLLVEAGVSSVVLNLVCACGGAGAEGPARRVPLALFAPDPALGSSPMAAPTELKQVIRAFHAVGLEVLLGVEFCSTAEADDADAQGGLQGLKGLDRAFYYRPTAGGMVLKAGHPLVRRMALDCLHHWVEEYCVDGFVVLNAEHLTQDQFGGILDNPPLPEEIATDPILRHLRLIAAPGDSALLPRNGQRGFPHWGVWSQWNNRFADDMNAYLGKDTRGMLSAVATRLTGSPDLFAAQWDTGFPGGLASGRAPRHSINAIQPACLYTPPLPPPPPTSTRTPSSPYPGGSAPGAWGGTGEGGVGGVDAGSPPAPATSGAVAAAKVLLLAQFASAGIPAFHCSLLCGANAEEMARFLSLLSTVRRSYSALLSPPAFDSPRAISWQAASPYDTVDWSGSSSNVLAFTVGSPGKGVLAAFNPQPSSVAFSLPAAPEGCCAWRKVVDTSVAPPHDATLEGPTAQAGAQLQMAPGSGMLFIAVPTPASAQATQAGRRF